MMVLFLLFGGIALADDDLDELDDLGAGYNGRVDHATTVLWHPLMAISGTIAVTTEFRRPDSSYSYSFGGGPYAYAGFVGLASMGQVRRYVLGDFDQGLYFGGHVGFTYAEYDIYYYFSAVAGGVTGGKWSWPSGLTIDQFWGVGYYSGWGLDLFSSVGIGWSW